MEQDKRLDRSDDLDIVQIYTDGACAGNPGTGGYAVVLINGKTRTEKSGGFRLTTNNRMEIYAAIIGLEMLEKPSRVILYSDSRYLVDAMTLGWVVEWKSRNWWRTRRERAINIDLWEKLLGLCKNHQVEFAWLKGHAGNNENERCDNLSNREMKGKNLPADIGYENKPDPADNKPITNPGEPCRHCLTPVILRKSKKANLYLYCPKCHAIYHLKQSDGGDVQNPRLF